MHDAATLLTSTFLTVKEIMVRVGFSDESHFVRYFKRSYGMTPTQYRRLNRRPSEAMPTEPTSGKKQPINSKNNQ
jgi:AraC-like DNA-binding protein